MMGENGNFPPGRLLEQVNRAAEAARLLDTLEKKIRELVGGYGGLHTFARFLHQVSHIGRLSRFKMAVQVGSVVYYRLTRMVDPQYALKRSQAELEGDAIALLGYKRYADWAWRLARMAREEFLNHRSTFTVDPRTILVYAIYEDEYYQAYVSAYKAMRELLSYLAGAFGMERFEITDPQFSRYLYLLRTEGIKGETRISTEEKGLLQFIFYGNLLGFSEEDAEAIIKAGLEVMKYGYLTEMVDPAFETRYVQAQERFAPLWADYLSQLEKLTGRVGQPPPRREIEFEVPPSPDGKFWFPFLAVEKAAWVSGQLAARLTLYPLEDFPMYAGPNRSSITTVFAPPGKGKTIILNALTAQSVFQANHVVFSPMAEDRNQLCLACMPAFPVSRRTKKLVNLLADFGIEPSGIPVLILNVVASRVDEEILRRQATTIFDRLVYVEDPKNVSLDFNLLLEELKAVADEHYGINKPVGVIMVRNLSRKRFREKVFVDLQIGYSLVDSFTEWRYRHKNVPMRLQFDELADFAPAQLGTLGADTLGMSISIAHLLRVHRGGDLAIDVCSQRPIDIIMDVKDLSENILFRDLSSARRTEQSQIDYVEGILQLRDPALFQNVKKLNEAGELSNTHFFFWWNRTDRDIELVQAVPPPFAVEEPGLTHHEYFKLYEKRFGKRLLARLEELPVIQGDRSLLAKPKHGRGSRQAGLDLRRLF